MPATPPPFALAGYAAVVVTNTCEYTEMFLDALSLFFIQELPKQAFLIVRELGYEEQFQREEDRTRRSIALDSAKLRKLGVLGADELAEQLGLSPQPSREQLGLSPQAPPRACPSPRQSTRAGDAVEMERLSTARSSLGETAALSSPRRSCVSTVI